MTMSGAPPKWATISLPNWIWGSDPAAFFAEAGLHAKPSTRLSDTWSITTDEQYLRARPSLITVDHPFRPGRPPSFGLLTSAAGKGYELNIGARAKVQDQLSRIRERAARTGSLVDQFYLWHIEATLAEPTALEQVAREVIEALTSITFESSDEKVFSKAGVHAIQRSRALGLRTKLPSVLLRVEHDQDLSGTAGGPRVKLEPGRAFQSGSGLLHGIGIFDAYIGPMMGALTPHIWSFAAPTGFGCIVFSLGRSVIAVDPVATELLHLLPHEGAAVKTWQALDFHADACADAIGWWGQRLNEMFGVLTNLAVFTDRECRYNPAKHQQALLTVEQLFRRVGSIQACHRDVNASRVLLFTVLDTLERLTGRPIDTLCHLPYAERTLQRLKDELNPQVASILLPGAERAISALKQVQDGFFIPFRDLDPAAAAAQYIKLLRNATHGHGSNRNDAVARTNKLLAHHDGVIPPDLPLLGYTYLLDLMTRPQDLLKHLYRGGAL